VGIVATSDGRGYWIACSTGGVFNFGDAPPHGSAKAGTPGLPIVAMAATPDGGGYWLADANGTVFAFGDAPRLHPVAAASPVAGLAVTPMGTGAFLAEQNGTVLGLGTAASDGSLSDVSATSPVVSIAEVVVPPPTISPMTRRGQRQGPSPRGRANYGSAFGSPLVAPLSP